MTSYIQGLAQKTTDFLQQSLQQQHKNGYIVCVSGGVDSAVGLSLAAKAIGPKNVLALIMDVPGLNRQQDMNDAIEYAKSLGVNYKRVDMSTILEAMQKTLGFLDEKSSKIALNRLRLTTAYSFADQFNFSVMSCGNYAEECTRPIILHGGGSGDCFPFTKLYKTEMYGLAKYLKIPQKFIDKTPSDSFVGKQQDMDYIGNVKYSNVDRLLYLLVNKKYKATLETKELATLLMGLHFRFRNQLKFPELSVEDSDERERFMRTFGEFEYEKNSPC